MRLDHLLSKDRLCGGGFLVVCCCLGRGWSGPAGAAPAEGSWLLLLLLACVAGWGGWLPCVGVGDTPAAACFGGGGCSRVRGVCVCGGGMLSGFWGSAPWLPGLLFCCLFCGWWGVGVGGLVVNCIVDASILL